MRLFEIQIQIQTIRIQIGKKYWDLETNIQEKFENIVIPSENVHTQSNFSSPHDIELI